MNEATEMWQKNFNLSSNLTKDILLRNRLAALTTRLSDMGGSDAVGMAYIEERNRIITSIWKDCGHNFSLLTPYFFPTFPKGKPMSMIDRPFNMCMMFSLPFWDITMRGSRQVGKTTTLGTRIRIIMELFRRYRSIYVAPHTEPLKTFARKYDEISQGFRNPVRDATKFTQNLYFKKYPSGGSLELVRIQTSATPARGKTADEVEIDETVHANSTVIVHENNATVLRKISDMRVGMVTVDFDENTELRMDRVTGVVCKGARHTWRIDTSGGKHLVCTGSTRIRTSQGWFSACEFISWREATFCEKTLRAKTVLAEASKIDPGYTTWRQEHGFFRAAQTVLTRCAEEAHCNKRKSPLEGSLRLENVAETEKLPMVLTVDGWEEATSVSYQGLEEVWDIETEKHHTFFANGIAVHNCQLFDPDLEVEVLETLNDSDIRSVLYAGTSTNFDSLLELRYQEGSQATWQILLDGGGVIDCGDPDAIIPYIGEYGMLDPETKKRIDPLRGYYRFNNPGALMDRKFSVHIPQIINPDICNSAIKWNALYRTLMRDPAKFVQEKLGIPQESASREITKDDLKRMCRPDIVGSPEERLRRCRTGFYKLIVSGVDWGGSDYNQMTKTKISSTVHFILGLTTDNQLHIINIRRHGGMDYKTIINLIAADHSKFNATSIATDFGVGETYHELMRSHPVFNTGRHVIFHYTGPRSSVCSIMKGALSNTMNLNRTETLSSLFLAISMPEPMILAPSWDEMEDFLMDFLNIHRILQEKEGEGGQRQFLYHRVASKTDDTVHAANFAFSLIRLVYNQILLKDNNARAMLRSAVLGSDAASAQGNFVMPSNVNTLIQQANESWKESPEDWYHTDEYRDYE